MERVGQFAPSSIWTTTAVVTVAHEIRRGVAMRKLMGLLAVLGLFCAGCVSVAELPQGAQVRSPVPADTQAVVIRPTGLKPGAVKNVEGLSDGPEVFARSLRDALKKQRPTWDIALADAKSVVPERGIAINTELLNIDGGSAALRFWIGLNTGAAESNVHVSILDKAGTELATAQVSTRTVCPVGACVEPNEATVRRNLQSLADETAEFIVNPVEYEKKKRSGG
jgi:hypothetical protein